MFENEDQMINYLFEQGALELYGMTDDGQITYRFDMPKLKEVLPELYDMMMADVDESLLYLYENGYVDITYDDNLEPSFELNEEGALFMKEQGYDISDWQKRKLKGDKND